MRPLLGAARAGNAGGIGPVLTDTARAVIDYIEGLTLTLGRFAGQPFLLH